MKKFLSLLLMMLTVACLGLVGCADIYANIKIEVSETAIVLSTAPDSEEGPQVSQELEVNISGLGDVNMVKKLYAEFQPSGIATVSNWKYSDDGNKAWATVSAQADGKTKLYIKGQENSIRISSSAIDVTVIQPVESVTVNTNVFVGVPIGGQINLKDTGVLGFLPSTTSETEINYSIATTKGITVSGNILAASELAEPGLITINARSTRADDPEDSKYNDPKLITTFQVMVYTPLESGDIKFYKVNSVEEVSDMLLTLNAETTNRFEFSIIAGDSADLMKISFKENSKTFKNTARIVPGTNSYTFVAEALESGTSSVTVCVDIVDSSGNVYFTATRDLDIRVERVVDTMKVTSGGVTQTFNKNDTERSMILSVFKQSEYDYQVLGTEFKVGLEPSTAETPYFTMELLKINGSTENMSTLKNSIFLKTEDGTVVNFTNIDGRFLTKSIYTGTALFASFTGEDITQGFTVRFTANSQDARLPVAYIDIEFRKAESVGEIVAPDNVVIAKDGVASAIFTVSQGTPSNAQFDVSIDDNSVASFTSTGTALTFNITAKNPGSTTMTITERGTQKSASFVIKVVVPMTDVTASISGTGVTKVNKDTEDEILFEAWVDRSSSYNRQFAVSVGKNPTTATVESVNTTVDRIEGQGSITVGIYIHGSSSIAMSAPTADGVFEVTLSVKFWELQGDNSVVEKTQNMIFIINVFQPITGLSWSSSSVTTEKTVSVYDGNTLTMSEQGNLNKINLTAYVLPGGASNRNQSIEWSYLNSSDANYLTSNPETNPENFTTNTGIPVSLWASLPYPISIVGEGGYDDHERIVRLIGSITDLDGRVHTVTCTVTIMRAGQITGLGVKDYDPVNGVYLEVGGSASASNSSYEVQPLISGATALNSNLALSYVLYSEKGGNKTLYLNPAEDPVYIEIVNNKPVIKASTKVGTVFEDEYSLRILPSSMLNVVKEDNEELWMQLFENASVKYDIKIKIGDGSATRPYKIYTENDLIDIGKKGLDKNYVLMHDITLTEVWTPIPGTFTGSLTSMQYQAEVVEFTIFGLRIDTAVSQGYVGLFEKLGIEAVIENIRIETNGITVTAGTLTGDLFVGVLAGSSASIHIKNVEVYTSEGAEKSVNVSGGTGSLYVGGLVGENTGVIVDSSAQMTMSINSGVVSCVGGLVGVNSTIIEPGFNYIIQGTYVRMEFTILEIDEDNYQVVINGVTYLYDYDSKTIKDSSGIEPDFNGVGVVGNGYSVENDATVVINSTSMVENLVTIFGIEYFYDGTKLYVHNKLVGRVNKSFVVSDIEVIGSGIVGGVVGLNSANSRVENFEVRGNIVALGAVVGGVVGDNRGILKEVTSSATVSGGNYVGGIAGKNSGSISYATMEFYDMEDSSSTAVTGVDYVGGLVGSSTGGTIRYSFATSYVKYIQVFRNAVLNTNEFYGDVLGSSYVGGLIGSATDTNIVSCFARLKLGISGNSPENIGGLIGYLKINNSSFGVTGAYAITSIMIYGNNYGESYGGLVGNVQIDEEIGDILLISTTYSVVDSGSGIQFNDLSRKNNFVGVSNSANAEVTSSSYFAGTSSHVTTSYGADHRTLANMQDRDKIDDWGTGWGWGTIWADYANSIGFNDNLPILLREGAGGTEAGWLFTKELSHIGLTTEDKIESEDSILPTMFEVEEGKLVVALDNLKGDKKIVLADLISVTTNLDGDDTALRVSIKSSDSTIAAVRQNSSGWSDAELIFKKSGTVEITITSLQNPSIKASFQICVIGGFSDFSLNYNGSEIEEGDTLQVYINSSNNIVPILIRDLIFDNSIGVKYNIWDTSVAEFEGNAWVGSTADILVGDGSGHILTGKTKSLDSVAMSAELYANLMFFGEGFGPDGERVRNTSSYLFNNTKLDFNIKVFDGVTDAKLSSFAAGVENFTSVPFTLTIFTDVADGLDSEGLEDLLNNFCTMEITSDNLLTSEEIKNKTAEQIAALKTEKINALNLIPSITDISSSASSMTVIYLAQFPETRLQQDLVVSYKFTIKDESGNIIKELTLQITWKPSNIQRLDVKHYLDLSSYSDTSASSTEISTGRLGVLKLVVTPEYADIDYLLVSSSQALGDRVTLEQKEIKETGSGKELVSLDIVPEYTAEGALKIKISDLGTEPDFNGVSEGNGYSISGNIVTIGTDNYTIYNNKVTIGSVGYNYNSDTNKLFKFDGVVYLSTLLSSGLAEGTKYTISVVGYNNNGTLRGTGNVVLTTMFAPYVSMKIDQPVGVLGNVVARGTVATVKVTGVAQNSNIIFSYSGVEQGTTTKQCVLFGQSDYTERGYQFQSGERQNIDKDIYLYIGIDALHSGSSITLTATITSTSALGGVEVSTRNIELYIVDYIVSSLSIEGESGTALSYSIQNGFVPLKIKLNTTLEEDKEAAFALFKKYVIAADETAFKNSYTALTEKIANAEKDINSFGTSLSVEKAIWFSGASSGSGSQLNSATNYANFAVQDVIENNEVGYFKIKGKNAVANLPFYAAFNCFYEKNSGIYESQYYVGQQAVSTSLKDSERQLLLDFTISFENTANMESPDPITNQEQLANMAVGGHYIMMNDIDLTGWVPLTTAIGSLDGNGYVINLKGISPSLYDGTTQKTVVNAGLFDKIGTFTDSSGRSQSTILKNLIIDVSELIFVDLSNSQIQEVNFGFVAGISDGGIIYNCEVVTQENYNIVKDGNTAWMERYSNTNTQAIPNVEPFALSTFVQLREATKTALAANADVKPTVVSTFVVTSGTSAVTVGGIVGQNKGYISNSRVGRVTDSLGRDIPYILSADNKVTIGGVQYSYTDKRLLANGVEPDFNGTKSGTGYTTTTVNGITTIYVERAGTVSGINLFSTGTLGGIAGTNTGIIGSSYFANGNLINSSSSTTGTVTGGLVGLNSGNISASYSEGITASIVEGSLIQDGTSTSTEGEEEQTETLDKNAGRVTIGTIFSKGTVGGFVHTNNGTVENCYSNMIIASQSGVGGFVYNNAQTASVIENCYSVSTVLTLNALNGAFTGLNKELNVNNKGTVENCYFMQGEDLIIHADEPAVELVKELFAAEDRDSFIGFVFSEETGERTWKNAETVGIAPRLVQAEKVAISFRDFNPKTDPEDTTEAYTYSYSTETIIGTEANPGIIYNTTSFDSWFSNSDSNYKQNQYARVVADIDFMGLSPTYSSSKTFSGNLQGNGMTIKDFGLLSNSAGVNYIGLFAQLNNATVANLNIRIGSVTGTQTYAVGALAGKIDSSQIENIKILARDSNSKVTAYNVAGGLAGVIKDTFMQNVKSKVSVYTAYDIQATNNYVYYNSDTLQKNISYAGGIAGVLTTDRNYGDNMAKPIVVNNMTTGNIEIQGHIVGGVFGLVDTNAVVSRTRFIVLTESQKLNGLSVAGGLVGENRGVITRSYIGADVLSQQNMDSALQNDLNPEIHQGGQNLFVGNSNVIGGLVGLNRASSDASSNEINGLIEFSYSRVAVVNTKAKVAGGIIGMAVDEKFFTGTNDGGNGTTINLKEISTTTRTQTIEMENNSENTVKIFGKEFDKSSAYLNNIYTTSSVTAADIAGGLVGIAFGPINTAVMSDNDTALAVLPYKITGTTKGVVVGKALYSVTNHEKTLVLFAHNDSDFSPAGDVVVAQISGTNQQFVGNVAASSTRDFEKKITEGITLAEVASNPVSSEQAFANFDRLSGTWNFDDELTDKIFPQIKLGAITVTIEIKTAEEFLENIVPGKGGRFRITQDIVFDFSDAAIRNKFPRAISANNTISGQIEGFAINVAGKSKGDPITITVKNIPTSDYAFNSFFGYVSSLTLGNINFKFGSTGEVNANTTTDNSFGLLANQAQNSSFVKIGISSANADDANIIFVPNGKKAVGAFVGQANNCSFERISLAGVEFKNDNYIIPEESSTNTTCDAYFGGVFGIGMGNNSAVAITDLNWKMNLSATPYNSGASSKIAIGGVAGFNQGQARFGKKDEQISTLGRIEINLKATNINEIYIGGVLGQSGTNCIVDGLTTTLFSAYVDTVGEGTPENIYMGGLVGSDIKTQVADVNITSSLTLEGKGNSIYAGGLFGKLISNVSMGETVSQPISNSVADTDIVIDSRTANAKVYAGGLVGDLQTIIKDSAGSQTAGTPLYSQNFASGSINLSAVSGSNRVSAGGLLGNSNCIKEEGKQEYIPLGIFTILNSASDVDITVSGFKTSYIGGIAGYNSLQIDTCISYGLLSFTATTNNSEVVNLGGIAGRTSNKVVNCLSAGLISNNNMLMNNIGAVIGKYEQVSGIIGVTTVAKDSFYCLELNGTIQEDYVATSLSLSEILNGATTIKANWIFNQDGDGTWLPVVNALRDIVPASGNTKVEKIANWSTLVSMLGDNTSPRRSVLLAANISPTADLGSDLTNIGRLLGNGYTITLPEGTSASIFGNIPANTLVSGLVISGTEIVVADSADSAVVYGALARTNEGVITKCVVGYLPKANNQSGQDLATVSAGVEERNPSTELETLRISVTLSHSRDISVGALVGRNTGTINNVWSFADIVIENGSTSGQHNYFGGLVGENTTDSTKKLYGLTEYVYTLGKMQINVINTGNTNYYLGGVIGRDTANTAQLLGMKDISVGDANGLDSHVGGVVGYSTKITLQTSGIVYTDDLNSRGLASNDYGTKASFAILTTGTLSTLGLDSLWSRNSANNYGLPYLLHGLNAVKTTVSTIATGTGGSADPYQIHNPVQLDDFVKKTNTCFILTRNLEVFKAYTYSSTSSTLNGGGKIITMNSSTLSGTTYSLFNTSLSANGKLEFILLDIKFEFGTNNNKISTENLSIAPLLTKNAGKVENCAAFGTITIFNSNSTLRVSGLVGENTATINQCWSSVDIKASVGTVGGLVGKMSGFGELTQSFAEGTLEVTGSAGYVGGLIGEISSAAAAVKECYYFAKDPTKLGLKGGTGVKVGIFVGNISHTTALTETKFGRNFGYSVRNSPLSPLPDAFGQSSADSAGSADEGKLRYTVVLSDGTNDYTRNCTLNAAKNAGNMSQDGVLEWNNTTNNLYGEVTGYWNKASGKLPYLIKTTPADKRTKL